MAPKGEESADFKFIMTTLKYTADRGKQVDWEAVAAEIGAANGTACYKRHWTILNKWGLTGTGNKGKGGAAKGDGKVAKATTPRKSKNAAKKTKVKKESLNDSNNGTSDIDDENSLNGGTPAKKRAAKIKQEDHCDYDDDGDDAAAGGEDAASEERQAVIKAEGQEEVKTESQV